MCLYIQFLCMFTRKIYYKLMNEMFFLIYFFVRLPNKTTENKTKNFVGVGNNFVFSMLL